MKGSVEHWNRNVQHKSCIFSVSKMQPRNVTACLSRLHLASSRPQPSPPPDACKKASVRGVTAGNSHMLGLRSATSSLLARSFASAVPKFDPSKLNGFIKGNDAKYALFPSSACAVYHYFIALV